MRKKILALILLVLLSMVGIYFQFFNKSRGSIDLSRIEVSPVITGKFYDILRVTGQVVPIRTVYLNTFEAGRIKEIYVNEGEQVSKGQVIIRMENSDLQLRILNSEAALTEQTSRIRDLRLAMDNQLTAKRKELIELKYTILQKRRLYESNVQLFEKQYVSKHDLQTSKEHYEELLEKYQLLNQQHINDSVHRIQQLEQMNESYQLMQSNLLLVRRKLDELTVKAPIDGIISSLSAEVGETKTQGSQLGVITVQTAVKIRAELDAKQLGSVTPGMTALLFTKNKQYELTVGRVSTVITNGHFEVDCRLNDVQPAGLYIGSSVMIGMELASPQTVTIIPKGDFMSFTDGDWIFVVDKTGRKAKRRSIRLNRQNKEFYEVTSGLKSDEKIIINGYSFINQYDVVYFN